MINRTLARRLEQLERRMLPDDTPQPCIDVEIVSSDGEIVDTRVIKLGPFLAEWPKRPTGQATDNVNYRAPVPEALAVVDADTRHPGILLRGQKSRSF